MQACLSGWRAFAFAYCMHLLSMTLRSRFARECHRRLSTCGVCCSPHPLHPQPALATVETVASSSSRTPSARAHLAVHHQAATAVAAPHQAATAAVAPHLAATAVAPRPAAVAAAAVSNLNIPARKCEVCRRKACRGTTQRLWRQSLFRTGVQMVQRMSLKAIAHRPQQSLHMIRLCFP